MIAGLGEFQALPVRSTRVIALIPGRQAAHTRRLIAMMPTSIANTSSHQRTAAGIRS